VWVPIPEDWRDPWSLAIFEFILVGILFLAAAHP
jgi:hypothetical protein